MSRASLNAFLAALREFVSAHMIAEKWLLAPSLRVGYQWLDALTRAGQPVLNVRVKTVRHMTLDLATPEMERWGATPLSGKRLRPVVPAGRA